MPGKALHSVTHNTTQSQLCFEEHSMLGLNYRAACDRGYYEGWALSVAFHPSSWSQVSVYLGVHGHGFHGHGFHGHGHGHGVPPPSGEPRL